MNYVNNICNEFSDLTFQFECGIITEKMFYVELTKIRKKLEMVIKEDTCRKRSRPVSFSPN